jgi:hypothetical protein
MTSAEIAVVTNELHERLGGLERRMENLRGHL